MAIGFDLDPILMKLRRRGHLHGSGWIERQTVEAIAFEACGLIQRTRRRRAHNVEEVRATRVGAFFSLECFGKRKR
jgi:hypothetical protein